MNQLEWKHISDHEPEDNSEIVKLIMDDEWYDLVSFSMIDNKVSWKEVKEWRIKNNLPPLDFWWMYKADFPFPKKS